MIKLYYTKKFFFQKYKLKSVEENIYSHLIKLTFLNGKKTKILNKFNLSFALFKLNLKRNLFKKKKKFKFKLNYLLKFFLRKSKLKYKFRIKRVGGVYHEIPEFKNPKQESLWTLKLFIRYINVHRYFYSFINKFAIELSDFFINKSLFKKLKNKEDKLAFLNKPYIRYLKFFTKRQIRHSTKLFKLRIFRTQPFYKNIENLFNYKFFRKFQFNQKFLFLKHKIFLYNNKFKLKYKLLLPLMYKYTNEKKLFIKIQKNVSNYHKYIYIKNYNKYITNKIN